MPRALFPAFGTSKESKPSANKKVGCTSAHCQRRSSNSYSHMEGYARLNDFSMPAKSSNAEPRITALRRIGAGVEAMFPNLDDIVLWGVVAFGSTFLIAHLAARLAAWMPNQAARLRQATSSMLASAAISRLETLTITSSVGITSLLFMVSATSTDDALDSALLVVAGLVALTLVLSASSLAFGLLYAISPASSGDSLRKLSASDALNVFLCSLRIVLCWARYVFYDIQVEGIDLALHYTDEILVGRTSTAQQH